MMRATLALFVVLGACTDTSPTSVEIRTTLATDVGITQLRITGPMGGEQAFTPGMLPEQPRDLNATESAVILLPDMFDGNELELHVDAMSDGAVIDTGVATVTIEMGEMRSVEIEIDAVEDIVIDDDSGPVDASHPNAILTYAFLAANNEHLATDVSASILGSHITAALPKGADSKHLVAAFTTEGEEVTVDSTAQVSGQTENDFSASALTYRVRATDGSIRSYFARATVIGSDQPTLLSFGFASRSNGALPGDAIGTFSASEVSVVIASGTDRGHLTPTFCAYGNVTVDGQLVTSGETELDFSTPRSVSIETAKGTRTYDVTVAAN